MSDKKIKPEKDDIPLKKESSNMNIDDEDDDNIFNEDGNLDDDNENMAVDDDDEGEINDKDSWKVIRAYFKQHGLVSQQIGSFNQFVDKNIQEIIDENKTLSIEVDTNYQKKDHEDEAKYEYYKEIKEIAVSVMNEGAAIENGKLTSPEGRRK